MNISKSKLSCPKVEALKSGVFRVRHYANSKRISKTFKSRIEADEYLSSLEHELALPTSLQITEDERMHFLLFKNQCATFGLRPLDLFGRMGEILRIEHTRQSISLDECIEKYDAHMNKSNLRGASIKTNTGSISRMKAFFNGSTNIYTINRERL